MTALSDLQDAATGISSGVDTAVAAINDLAAKVAAGGTVSDADLTAITGTLTSATTTLSNAVAAATAPVTPPVDTPPADEPPVAPDTEF